MAGHSSHEDQHTGKAVVFPVHGSTIVRIHGTDVPVRAEVAQLTIASPMRQLTSCAHDVAALSESDGDQLVAVEDGDAL